MSANRSFQCVFLGIVISLATISWVQADQEIEEADLVELELGIDPIAAPDLAHLEGLYAQAQEVFASADQPNALPLLSELINLVQSRSTERTLLQGEKALLSRSLLLRAELSFNLGDNGQTGVDLRQAILVEPSIRIDLDRTSPKLARLFDQIQNELVGYVDFRLDPPDMEIHLDGFQLDLSSSSVHPILAGVRNILARRPGYESIDDELEVKPGTRFELDLALQRSSSALVFALQPSESEIFLDGQSAAAVISKPVVQVEGETLGPEGQVEIIAVPEVADVMIGGLLAGSHTLEVRHEGYRPKRIGFEIEEMRDYTLPDVVALELTRGELTIIGIPDLSTLRIDGQEQGFSAANKTFHTELTPGEHLIQVEAGFSGRFEDLVQVADQDVLTIPVRLRPVVVFLGVLGDDGVAAPALLERLTKGLGGLDNWYLFDRSSQAAPILGSLGVTAAALRETSGQTVTRSQGPDWPSVQKAMDAQFKAPVFLLAVLSDDLFATTADLWIWAAEPYPSLPSVRRVALEDREELDAVVASFAEIMSFERLSFGASFIDSNATDTPVVSDISLNSPAALAGLKLGDRLLSVDGRNFAVSQDLRAYLKTLHEGTEVGIEVENGQGRSSHMVMLERSSSVLTPTDRNLLLPVASAKVANEVKRSESNHPEWLLKLNQAAILMHVGAWREAVPLLRNVSPPADLPLGQAAVDYWLGRALMAVDPVAYRDRAREAYARAAQDTAGRLYHSDGPFVAPRAKRRLMELGGS